MLDQLSLETFIPLVGQTFTLPSPQVPSLALVAATAVGAPYAAGGRTPFTLLFHGPIQPILAQQICPLTHPELGTLELFLVPLGPSADRTVAQYEAIFT